MTKTLSKAQIEAIKPHNRENQNMVDYLEGDYQLIDKPLAWQLRGLQETATGYGAKLTSGRVVRLADGRERRVYVTCYSNNCSAWITLGGKRLYLRD